MSCHYFESKTQVCLGCDISMSEVADGFGSRAKRKADPRIESCPSTARLINDEKAGILAVITAPDRLVISDGGGEILRLGPTAAREIGSAINGMRWVR